MSGLTREDCEEYGRPAGRQCGRSDRGDRTAGFQCFSLRDGVCRVNTASGSRARSLRRCAFLGSTIPNLSELGLPEADEDRFSSWNKGIILVTGETEDGKSTTLAAILNRDQPESSDPYDYAGRPDRVSMNRRRRSSTSARSAWT